MLAASRPVFLQTEEEIPLTRLYEIARESVISIVIIRKTIGFAMSHGINPWIDGMGPKNCFITVAMLSLACTFTFLPMVFTGNNLRRLSAPKYWEYVATSATPRR